MGGQFKNRVLQPYLPNLTCVGYLFAIFTNNKYVDHDIY